MRTHAMPRTLRTLALLAPAAAALPAVAAPGDVSWELIRPTNTGVPGDYTHAIFIDDDDSPWITGYVPFWEEGGVGHFDGERWRVLGNVDCPQVISPRFNDIVKTADGIMWIGSDNGLLRFDPTVEPWCVTRFHRGNTPMKGNQVTDIDIAPDGTLWIANQEVGGSSAGGVGQYDPATGSWQFWDTTNGLPWWAGWDWVDSVAVQPDAAGGYTVWFEQGSMGLCSYKDGLFIWYGSPTPPDLDPMPLGLMGRNATRPNGDMLMSTSEGIAFRHPDGSYTVIGGAPVGLTSEVSVVEPLSGGRVALGTYYADVFVWDEGVWTHLGNWGSGSHTYTITEDSTGAIWAGGIGGASHYENGDWQRVRLTNTGMLDFFATDVALAPDGDVAMTANAAPGVGGFDIMHPDRTWTNANGATDGMGLPWPYPTDNTSAVAFRPNGNLLFAPTNNGLREYDGQEFLDLITLTYDVEHIGFTNAGRGWAATGQSTAFGERPDGTWAVYGTAAGLPPGSICGIVADPTDDDLVWIGTAFGLARTDGVTWDVVPREAVGLDQDTLGYHITAFDVAADGTLWIASGIGLFHYDPATGLYDTYDLTNAPLPSDDIFNVEIAPDGSVWISMFDHVYPYPGGVAQLKEGQWRVWQQPTSRLPHNQINDIESRPVPGGYEIWIACASEAIAVMTVEGDAASCPADLAEPFGSLNFFDIAEFVARYNAGDPSADLADPIGTLNFFDVAAYLDLYNAGCP